VPVYFRRTGRNACSTQDAADQTNRSSVAGVSAGTTLKGRRQSISSNLKKIGALGSSLWRRYNRQVCIPAMCWTRRRCPPQCKSWDRRSSGLSDLMRVRNQPSSTTGTRGTTAAPRAAAKSRINGNFRLAKPRPPETIMVGFFQFYFLRRSATKIQQFCLEVRARFVKSTL